MLAIDVDLHQMESALAAVTNRMACQSRCEIRVQASHRRILTACSRLSTPRNRAVWGLGCRSAGRLSKRITDDCGRAITCHVALSLASLRRPIRPRHREWNARCARQRDLGYAALSALVAVGRPCAPSLAGKMPASCALPGHDELLP